jgi:hypothetical protein
MEISYMSTADLIERGRVEAALRESNGDLRLDWRAEGFACEVILPM